MYGQTHSIRALLDSASQASFITEKCVNKLQLKRNKLNISIGGIGACGVGNARSSVALNIKSRVHPDLNFQVEAIVLKRVTENLPSATFDPSNWPHIKGLELADPSFYKPGEVDVLLGADIYGDLIQDGKYTGAKNMPVAFNTILGWAISGPLHTSTPTQKVQIHHCRIDDQLRQFWEIEEIPLRKHLASDETECESNFEQIHSRDQSGRYMVRLPFKKSPSSLGESRKMALRRFSQTERRLPADGKMKKEYTKFMDEYLALGHMKPTPKQDIDNVSVNQ